MAGTTKLPVHDVLDTLAGAFGGVVFEPTGRGGSGYRQAAVGPGGALVFWDGISEAMGVHVRLPGAACDELGLVGVVGAALACQLLPTRVDFAWDCEGISPAEVRGWFDAGDVVTRAHRESWRWIESATGSTFTLGARSSDRFLRCYDMRGPTRLELEVKGDRAQLVFDHLLAFEESAWSGAAMGLLRDFVDFRDRSTGVRSDFAQLLPKWAVVVDGASRTALPIARKPPITFTRLELWLERQVGPALAVWDAGTRLRSRPLALDHLLERGRGRWKSRHRALVASARPSSRLMPPQA
jgi:hypothetical protein